MAVQAVVSPDTRLPMPGILGNQLRTIPSAGALKVFYLPSFVFVACCCLSPRRVREILKLRRLPPTPGGRMNSVRHHSFPSMRTLKKQNPPSAKANLKCQGNISPAASGRQTWFSFTSQTDRPTERHKSGEATRALLSWKYKKDDGGRFPGFPGPNCVKKCEKLLGDTQCNQF